MRVLSNRFWSATTQKNLEVNLFLEISTQPGTNDIHGWATTLKLRKRAATHARNTWMPTISRLTIGRSQSVLLNTTRVRTIKRPWRNGLIVEQIRREILQYWANSRNHTSKMWRKIVTTWKLSLNVSCLRPSRTSPSVVTMNNVMVWVIAVM